MAFSYRLISETDELQAFPEIGRMIPDTKSESPRDYRSAIPNEFFQRIIVFQILEKRFHRDGRASEHWSPAENLGINGDEVMRVHRGSLAEVSRIVNRNRKPAQRATDSWLMSAALVLQELNELLQLRQIQIGDGPPLHAGVGPANQIVSLAHRSLSRRFGAALCGPDKNVDEMLAPLIDQRRDGPIINVVEAPALQFESLLRQIFDWRREVELAIEPWLDRVLVGRRNIHQMLGHQRAHMARDHFLRD